MKGKVNSRTATITMSRNDYINLWCHLTAIIKKDADRNLKLGLPITTAEATCAELGELLEEMYDDWLESTPSK